MKKGYRTKKSSYRSDANFLGDIPLIVNVHLVEFYTGEYIGKLLKNRRDLSARSTPLCPKVDYDVLVPRNLLVTISVDAIGVPL